MMMGFARSSGTELSKREGGGALALEPSFASSRGQARQRVAAARRRFEPTAELPDGLHPAVSVYAQTLQDRRELSWNRPLTHRPKLAAGPIQKRKVAVELDRQIALIRSRGVTVLPGPLITRCDRCFDAYGTRTAHRYRRIRAETLEGM